MCIFNQRHRIRWSPNIPHCVFGNIHHKRKTQTNLKITLLVFSVTENHPTTQHHFKDAFCQSCLGVDILRQANTQTRALPIEIFYIEGQIQLSESLWGGDGQLDASPEGLSWVELESTSASRYTVMVPALEIHTLDFFLRKAELPKKIHPSASTVFSHNTGCGQKWRFFSAQALPCCLVTCLGILHRATNLCS